VLAPRDVAETLLLGRGRLVDEFGFIDARRARELARANLAVFLSLDVDGETALALADALRRLEPEDLLAMRETSERETRAALALWYATRDPAALAPLVSLLAPVYFTFPELAARALCAAAGRAGKSLKDVATVLA
jgi:hypothetical protein